jgi:hypothetical protein
VAEGFKFVEKWAAAQRLIPGRNIFNHDESDHDQEIVRQARSLSELVHLERLSHSFLLQQVKPLGFATVICGGCLVFAA